MPALRPVLFVLAGMVLMAGALGAVLASSGGDAEVRLSARRIDDGRVEIALQQTQDDGTWGERSLPEQRFLPADAEAGVWHSSNSLTVAGTGFEPPADVLSGDLGNFDNAVLICAITHEREGDRDFWYGVNRGLMGWDWEHPQARVDIRRGATAAEQSQQVRECVDDGAVAIAVTLPDPEGLRDALAEANEAGVMVTSFNSGVRSFRDLGSLRHVSIDEFEGGRVTGERLTDHGVTGVVLCVTHEPANIGLSERCQGLEAGYDGDVERISVADTGTADLDATSETIAGRLGEDGDSVGAVVALNAVVSLAALDAVEATGSDAAIATFDQTLDVLRAIGDGDILFAIDTQPYNQGYMAGAATLHTYAAWRGLAANYGIDANDIIGVYAITLEPRLWTEENAAARIILGGGRPGSSSGGGGRPGG